MAESKSKWWYKLPNILNTTLIAGLIIVIFAFVLPKFFKKNGELIFDTKLILPDIVRGAHNAPYPFGFVENHIFPVTHLLKDVNEYGDELKRIKDWRRSTLGLPPPDNVNDEDIPFEKRQKYLDERVKFVLPNWYGLVDFTLTNVGDFEAIIDRVTAKLESYRPIPSKCIVTSGVMEILKLRHLVLILSPDQSIYQLERQWYPQPPLVIPPGKTDYYFSVGIAGKEPGIYSFTFDIYYSTGGKHKNLSSNRKYEFLIPDKNCYDCYVYRGFVLDRFTKEDFLRNKENFLRILSLDTETFAAEMKKRGCEQR